MTGREEIVKTLAAVFVVRTEKWDDHNYPYLSDASIWEDHLQAFAAVQEMSKPEKAKIFLRHINVLNSGRVVSHDIELLYEDGKWVSDRHDPRMQDPDFRKYVELKKRFEE